MKKLLVLSVLLVIIVTNIPSHAQWQQSFGPFGWAAYNMASGNGYVYSSGGKIYRSSDDGMTWQEKGNGIWQWDVNAIFVFGSRVFVGTYENNLGYLYFSDDNGENWYQHNTTGNTNAITGFTNVGANLFFCTYQNGVFLSTDNGNLWVKTPGFGNQPPTTKCIVTLGNYLFLGTTDGVYRSSDNGTTWIACPNPSGASDVNSMTVKQNTLYVVYGAGPYYFSSVYKSTDYGSSYIFVADGSWLPYARSVFSEGVNVYLNTDDGVFRSTNDGLDWARIALKGAAVWSMAYSGGNLIAGTDNIGIFTSMNNGISWINTGFYKDVSVPAIASIGNTLITGVSGQSGILLSRDDGNSFTEYYDFSKSYVNCLEKRDTDLFAGTGPNIPPAGGVFKSSDYGYTWNAIGLLNKDILSIAFKDNLLFAGSVYDGIFLTSNDGATWTQVNTGLQATYVKSLAVLNDKVYAGTNSGLYLSTNNGGNWSLTGFQSLWVNALAVVDSKLFAGTESGVYLQETSGNWVQVGLQNSNIYRLRSLNSILFAAGYPDISISTDYGSTWISIKNNIGSDLFLDLTFNNNYIFAGTSLNGSWRRPLSEVITDVLNLDDVGIKDFVLHQNFPNPFNPSTKIKYSIPQKSNVVIKVFDVLGNEMETLVNEEKEQGVHTVSFDASELSSGIYFYRIQAGSFIETKKMILIK